MSDIEFKYQAWEDEKPRENRTYSHLHEWKEDILAVLRKNGGCIYDAQREIIKLVQSSVNSKITLSYTTFKRAIEELITEKRIVKILEGKGRSAKRTFQIKKGNILPLFHKKTFFNESNSYTFIDRVVDWSLPVIMICEIFYSLGRVCFANSS